LILCNSVANLSLIANSNDSSAIYTLNSVVQETIQAKKIVVAASGNISCNYVNYLTKFDNVFSVSAVEEN